MSPQTRPSAGLSDPVNPNPSTPALAVIDGTLCRLTRDGRRTGARAPLATAIVEFRHGPFRCFVREHPFGLLPGIPNLYCLDGAFNLLWLADWHDASDPCTGILGEQDGVLLARAASGSLVRLDALTGTRLGVEAPLAAAG